MNGISISRLRTIRKRQDPENIGSSYIPSILATREEAPSKSSPKILHSEKFGRAIHVLSDHELNALLIGMYVGIVFEIQEQKMLSTWESLHPLTSWPKEGLDESKLPILKGTIDVASRIDALDFHPYVSWKDENQERHRVPFPYIGDLLIFIDWQDERYCVNWNIKGNMDDFYTPRFSSHKKDQYKAKRKSEMRALLEDIYYADAGIRTQKIAFENVYDVLFRNLFRSWVCSELEPDLEPQAESDLIQAYRFGLQEGISPLEIILRLFRHNENMLKPARDALYRAIWNKKVEVDLFKPILFDYPLPTKQKDIIDIYAEWFKK